MNRVNNLDKRFADIQQDYLKELAGTKVQPARWKTCVDYVNGNVGQAVGALYIKHHFQTAAKRDAEEMITNIRAAFMSILDEVDWMDAETRVDAKVKAQVRQRWYKE